MNDSLSETNASAAWDRAAAAGAGRPNLIDHRVVQALLCVAYTVIFVLGVLGNSVVCFVVFRSRSMQTVTNLFISNLALADILLCVFAVPFTPLYTFRGTWSYGPLLCHLMPYAQGCSVYISTLTLTSIAVDRFFVIIYPFRPRMQVGTCVTVIAMIWTFSVTVTLPYAFYMRYVEFPRVNVCEETWPTERLRVAFGAATSALQFLLPFSVIAFCYTCVSFKLSDRARVKAAAKAGRKEEADRSRKRRTNQMLVAMVSVFGVSWLPLNVVNLCNDLYMHAIHLEYYFLVFFLCHVMAMSSTCYNPLIYAWMNENFRKEFKLLIPCIDGSLPGRDGAAPGPGGAAGAAGAATGTTTATDSCAARGGRRARAASVADAELCADVRNTHVSGSYNLRRESVQLRLISEESCDAAPATSL